ncbi:MAG: hypothetical protein HY537_18150 [Deltaproteobacteria bacterium]|nr:hypothetical protein [Deltaproteobacteria bacterium]
MKRYILLLIIGAVISNGVFSDDTCNHEASVEAAPQGGSLRDAPPFKSEIKIDGNIVKLYIYDQKLKAVKYDKDTLSGFVQFPRQEKKSISFKRIAELKPITIKNVGTITERYEASIPGINKVHRYDMHVNLAVGDKTARADFGVDNIH